MPIRVVMALGSSVLGVVKLDGSLAVMAMIAYGRPADRRVIDTLSSPCAILNSLCRKKERKKKKLLFQLS